MTNETQFSPDTSKFPMYFNIAQRINQAFARHRREFLEAVNRGDDAAANVAGHAADVVEDLARHITISLGTGDPQLNKDAFLEAALGPWAHDRR